MSEVQYLFSGGLILQLIGILSFLLGFINDEDALMSFSVTLLCMATLYDAIVLFAIIKKGLM